MSKILFFLLLIAMTVFVKAQSNFEYERAWGTYFGPVGAKSFSGTFNGKQIFFDSQDNIYTKGLIYQSSFPESYFQQFSLNGGQTFQSAPNIYSPFNYTAKFNSNGTLLYYHYDQQQNNNPGSYTKELMFVDQLDNRYYQYFLNTASTPVPITPGTWGTTATQYVISKYDANNNLIWATYQPSISRIITDNSQNVYISGITYNGQNVPTTGTYLDNFQYMTSMGNNYCGFLVKLNPDGQKLWGTFYPGYASMLKFHNNSIYLGNSQVPQTNQIIIPTAAAFQTTPVYFSLIKFNADNGTRTWATYYASPTGSSSIRTIEVNETGLYVLGDETYSSTNPNPNFYGTPGSHKPQITSAMDLFLTKFDHSGARIWSTYIGGTGTDLAQSSQQPLALSGDNIYICAQTWGASNIISTPLVHQQLPEQNGTYSTNHFFSKFNTNGVLQWTSYYGGTSQSADEPWNIAIHNQSLYFYGDTRSPNLYTTPGSWQNQYTDPFPTVNAQKNSAFLVKFNLKTLDTKDITKVSQIDLYDNPNKGNFSIRGEILRKENLHLSIFDLSGRVLYKKELSKSQNNEHHLNLEHLLQNGNYMVNVTDRNGVLIQNFKITIQK
ncbi:T9SS type A sorting domain-containing protein [Chryseobacterium caseinilyticum]|uniref:T9SS type A sorting domain-containing protein n=1 Tax=Chryseobacterium caseinilyticum TaxID=2771428 RepID=A0ABR8ZGI8_9FLAO|nr:T9SS type A sorting domain-containing protein [Chryseobacterium caseinilyticum]MBD8084342.1 T9SS type A sorting domain-containing protein [Chryseobacterium caseinilyticum]